MIVIQNAYISDDIAEKMFICDLEKCKGACCVEGDLGAPLEENELSILNEIYPAVKPYMTPEGIEVAEKQGLYIKDYEGDFSTSTINGKECIFAVYDEKKILKCGIEQAHRDGKIDFPKPISCHLYPIRITQYEAFDAINYNQWHICSPACSLGESLKVPVYQFLKGPLVRKYGHKWYEELKEAIHQNMQENKKTDK